MSDQPPHIMILASRLDLPGGTERMVVAAANLFRSKGHAVTLLIPEEVHPSFFPLDKSVQIVHDPLDFGITETGNIVTRKTRLALHVIRLRRAIKKINPSIIISTDYVYTICARLAINKKGPKVFAWEHHHFHWLNKSSFWRWLQRRTYSGLDGVICLNKTEAQLHRAAGSKTFVIPNFIEANDQAALESKTLLTVGWLIDRKGIDFVPRIASEVLNNHPDWKWIIVGSGDKKEQLKKSIHELHLEDRVSIVSPSTPDLRQIYLNASIYVMTSRFECFPMVLLEAMSFGIPSVAFNCPTGPSEIITNKVDGFLSHKGDLPAMNKTLQLLMDDSALRKEMGAAAIRNVERFVPEKIYPLWKEVFDQA
jgi:amylovoran biosynthesis glycosyltransferase AmsD